MPHSVDPREQPVQSRPPCDPYQEQYRATPESIARAKAEAAREREEVRAHLLSDASERGILALSVLVEAHGIDTVIRWTRNVASIYGRAL